MVSTSTTTTPAAILVVLCIFFLIIFLWNHRGKTPPPTPLPSAPAATTVPPAAAATNSNIIHYLEGNFTRKDLPIILYVDSTKVPESGPPTIGPMLDSLIRNVNQSTGMVMLRRLGTGNTFWGHYRPKDPSICIQFVRGHHGCRTAFDGKKRHGNDVLAHAHKSTICVDLDNQLTGKNLEQVLVHELGHSLGMGHTTDPGIYSIMGSTVTDDKPFPTSFTAYDVDVLHWLFRE